MQGLVFSLGPLVTVMLVLILLFSRQTDTNGAVSQQSFTVTVANVNDAPVITTSEVTSVNEDASYSYTFAASDVDVGDSVTISKPTIPSWLSFNAGTGVLLWDPWVTVMLVLILLFSRQQMRMGRSASKASPLLLRM